MAAHSTAATRHCTTLSLAAGLALAAGPAAANTVVYDSFDTPAYSLAGYGAKWANPYGLGEMAISDTRNFLGGNFAIKAPVFQTGFDFSVYDHLKYIATSTQSFAVPVGGSLTFSSTITATAHNTQAAGRIINGTYIQSGLPYSALALEGQQAGAVMNMIDFSTGQLFDWFISGSTAFTLIERLPSAVTNPALLPSDPNYVGMDKMYTQIINQIDIGPGPHVASITYSDAGSVSYFLDGKLVSQVDNVGIPLDKQAGAAWSGIYPSYGPGENLAGKVRNLTIGHGLFSLLDAYPFQHPERPDLAVSIPMSERLFGQGMDATFDDFTVTAVPEPQSWALLMAGLLVGIAAQRRRVPRR
ncbi:MULTISPECIES: DUF6081 family protein [unclassified Roseateles]|uniref:DUF6081 family protein n=1 Tax=unclassified Roseateles TaxID=2626991 RepID=UPI0006FF7875|nr:MULTISPECIES: DUF6081 family protein [unclassified Roseateles]KQW50806.1 hypothetical protein ASC81_24235 [Pelomonas sp. Root405]KRA70835.1 hypothetical protein ASD88_13380 [Pelomonas sp. Root662]